MKIYLMRHGQTSGDVEDRFGGDYEDHLTDLGKSQAKVLASKLLDLKIEKIFYSPRIRAVETAKIIEQVTNIPIETEDDLRERNAYGILTGELKSVAKEKYPELIEELKNPKATISGAEEYNLFKNRVINVFNKIVCYDLDTIGIITHGGVISCFLREVMVRERKSLADCALIELEYIDSKFVIVKSDGLELV